MHLTTQHVEQLGTWSVRLCTSLLRIVGLAADSVLVARNVLGHDASNVAGCGDTK